LSESEQEAYYAALYGDPDDFPVFDETQSEEEIEAQMEDFAYEPSGCQGEAYAESEDPSNRFYQDFGDELEELYERIQNDPRVVEAEQAVAECVADRGLEYTDEEGVYQQFEDELMEIDSMVDFPGQDLSEEELASMSDEELNALYSQPRELPQEALDKLADLQEREIALAVAVNECGGGFRNAEELYREVSAEHEQEFLDEHADELSDYEAGS
jgi:hypothetical protein